MTDLKEILSSLITWNGPSEIDLYPYVRDFFVHIMGYPKNKIKLNMTGKGGIPDLSLIAKDDVSSETYWLVAEIKPEPEFFRNAANRKKVWDEQLEGYVNPDTVYALLIDPKTLVIHLPNGMILGEPIELNKFKVDEILNTVLPSLSYANSVNSKALERFRQGEIPPGYIDVKTDSGRQKFFESLRISAKELANYATERIVEELGDYDKYESESRILSELAKSKDKTIQRRLNELKRKYSSAITLREEILEEFSNNIGRDVSGSEEQTKKKIREIYASEAASLVLSGILFVRFAEDYELTKRMISNGGIPKFRNLTENIKDDYKWLLKIAYADTKMIYGRLFEESIFDLAQEGNHQLSAMLERVFYRFNSFDFRNVTGDVLGNLYAGFLDRSRRKKLGEFYTPEPIAKYLLEASGFNRDPDKLMDPSCGSGTFLY